MGEERGKVLLDAICDEVDQRLNPGGDDCPFCGGEGVTYDCIDGCCVDAESGCDYCARKCVECVIFDGKRAKAVREEVIKSDDIDLAREWLKGVGRWHPDISDERIRQEIATAREALAKVGTA